MRPSAEIATGVVFEECGATFLARIKGNAATNITQASLTGITCKVYERDGDGTSDDPYTYELAATVTVTVSDVVFDTLQTGGHWTKDSTGYNFKHAMPGSSFPDGDTYYQVEYVFDPASGEDFALVFLVYAQELQSKS